MLSASNTVKNKKSSKFQTAGICVAFSIVLHLAVAVMICIRIISLQSEVIKDVEDTTDEKQEIVVKIELEPEPPTPELPTQPVIPPLNERAPLTPQELKELASKPPEPIQEEPRPKPEPELPKPEPQPKDIIQIARTTDDQLTGEVPDTNLQGERNTIAASNARPTAGAPDVSAVVGEKPEDNRSETVDTRFNDGEFEHMERGGSPSEAQIVPPSEITPPSEIVPPSEIPAPKEVADTDQKEQEEIKSSIQSTDDLGKDLEKNKIAETNKLSKEYAETQQKVAMNKDLPTSQNLGEREKSGKEKLENKTIGNKDVDPDGLKQKAQEKKDKVIKSQPKTQPKTAKNKRASDGARNGFRSEAKATVMEGSISRRSNIASKNVKATPVGKYMSQISKLVERGWQSRMMQHADLVQPGTMIISFMVDKRGKVRNINIVSQTAGSESQRSLTFQALLSAKIPPMPKEVIKSQSGDLLEFRYNFSFQ